MEDQLTFLHKLQQRFENTVGPKKAAMQLTSISGLGSEIWKGTNIDQYLDEERQW